METYLDRIELHGFKSFPDKTIIKLHKGITAIVGPNGCGKSNIVDSILWVMGEQRIKNLRGENNEDLIFNGSSSKKPLGMTEVGAYFRDNGDDIYIARRFFRTGDSKYILNERYCRNKDIQDQLFKLRLGGTNYFIFEQGSIEKLVSLKPSEKRILIEEAADISKYLIRKKETANKLIIAEQNLDNIQILIADKESRLRELRNQVNYVQRYRRAKNERTDHLKTYLTRKAGLLQKEFKQQQAEVEKLINQETVLVREIATFEKEVLGLEEKRWMLDKELKQNQQTIFDLNKQVMAAKSEMDRSRQSRGFKSQKIHDSKKSITDNKQEIADIDKLYEETTSNIKNLKQKLETETAGYEELETKVLDLNDRKENTDNDNAGLKSEIFNAQNELSRVSNKIKDIDKRMMRIENEVDSKQNFVKQLREQVSNDEIQQTEKELSELDKQHGENETLFKEAEARHKEIKQSVEQLNSHRKNYKNEINGFDNQKAKYLQVKKKIAGNSVDASGLKTHGLLQDLLRSDKQYHQLLENFYFEEMDALLLQNNHDILEHNLGKSLLKRPHPLPPEAAEIKNEPGFVAWVRDLFTLDDPALSEYFKNGALVEDLKTAIQLFVKYGIDVVTRDGETVTRDGLLIRNREKGILDVIEEIREIDEKKAEMEEKLTAVTAELETARAQQPELSKKVDTLRSALQQSERKRMQLKTSLDTLKKNRDTNLKRVEFTESEIELLITEKDKLQDDFEVLDIKNGELEEKFNQLSQQREEYNEEVNRLKEEINRAEKEYIQKENAINLIKEKINSSNAGLKSFRASKSKLENNIQIAEQEIVKLEEDIVAHKEKEAKLSNETEQLNSEKDRLEQSVKKREQEFNDLNTRIRGRSADLNTRRKALEEIKDSRQHIEITISSLKKDLFQLEEVAFKELNVELSQLESIPELEELPTGELEEKVEELSDRLTKMRDSNRLNFSAESEFELLTNDYNNLITQKEDVVRSIEDMNEAIRRIDEESKVSFMQAYDHIKTNFEKNFQILFEGGEAELSLMDPENVLESGLEIKAQPPGKRLLSLNLLSGGEKTLTSLAFLFAMFEYKPSPFCVFDEVDASLDEANIQRFLKFLHKLKQKTQFLIITHNFKTMEEADYLYGISMNEPGISTLYSMKMTGKGKFEQV